MHVANSKKQESSKNAIFQKYGFNTVTFHGSFSRDKAFYFQYCTVLKYVFLKKKESQVGGSRVDHVDRRRACFRLLLL